MQHSASVSFPDYGFTDIAGAQALGMRTALVRTGRFAPGQELPSDMQKPDADVLSLSELWDMLST